MHCMPLAVKMSSCCVNYVFNLAPSMHFVLLYRYEHKCGGVKPNIQQPNRHQRQDSSVEAALDASQHIRQMLSH